MASCRYDHQSKKAENSFATLHLLGLCTLRLIKVSTCFCHQELGKVMIRPVAWAMFGGIQMRKHT